MQSSREWISQWAGHKERAERLNWRQVSAGAGQPCEGHGTVRAGLRAWAVMSAACAMLFAGCGSETDSSATAKASSPCPAGLVAQYDPNTGKLASCVSGGDATSGDISGSGGADTAGGSDAKTGADGGAGGGGDAANSSVCKAELPASSRWWTCEPNPVNPTGALHGQSCKTDADCLYGLCMFGLPIAGYDMSIGICNKNCGFGGGKNVPCATENDNPSAGDTYYCTFERTAQIGNTMRDLSKPDVFKMCAHGCKNDDDCKAWNPDLPTCVKQATTVLSVNPNGVCVRQP